MFGKAGDELLTCDAITAEINRFKKIPKRSKGHQATIDKRVKELQNLFNEKCKEAVIGTDLIHAAGDVGGQILQQGQTQWEQLTDYFGSGTTPGMPGPVVGPGGVPGAPDTGNGPARDTMMVTPVNKKTWWIVGGVVAVGLFLYFRSRRN